MLALGTILRAVAETRWRVDKLHMQGHVGDWCARFCDPEEDRDLDGVNTVAAEIAFSWLSGFKTRVRHMNRPRFMWFVLEMLECRNRHTLSMRRTHAD